jgi:hypothetical protein
VRRAKHFAQPSEVPGILSYAAEWLLDNFYIVQQAVRQIREDMPTGCYRRLPKLESTPLEGYPRVYPATAKSCWHPRPPTAVTRRSTSCSSKAKRVFLC